MTLLPAVTTAISTCTSGHDISQTLSASDISVSLGTV